MYKRSLQEGKVTGNSAKWDCQREFNCATSIFLWVITNMYGRESKDPCIFSMSLVLFFFLCHCVRACVIDTICFS